MHMAGLYFCTQLKDFQGTQTTVATPPVPGNASVVPLHSPEQQPDVTAAFAAPKESETGPLGSKSKV